MPDRQSTQKFILGTAIKITVIIDIDSADSVLITIDNSEGTEVVTNASMTAVTEKVYSYTYQSSATGKWGDYLVTISITQGAYTSVSQKFFTLVEQE